MTVAGERPIKWSAVNRDTPLLGPFDYISDEIGLRFASLVDGEGCLSIDRSGNRKSWTTTFQINIRWDDLPFLQRVRSELGNPGVVRRTEPKFRPGDPNRRPQAYWRLTAKQQALWLTTVLDFFPLWSKKANDYAVWREAVMARSLGRGAGLERMPELLARIREARLYVEPSIPAGFEIEEFGAAVEPS